MNAVDCVEDEIGYSFPENTVFEKSGGGLKIVKTEKSASVRYSEKKDLARALLLLKTHKDEVCFTAEENGVYKDICFMADCSRNAVLNVETVKKLLRNAALLGYNSFMLYTEDTFEVDGEPFFGYLRGRYTKAELKEIDSYAADLGIELIPCVQTLAHLNALTRYKEYAPHFDCNDILLVGDERVYELIENIFATLSEAFTSRRVHIGMDEAKFLGLGQYLDKNGYTDPYEIFVRHLRRVCAIAEKYGFSPIMWSDMFWHITHRRTGRFDIPESVKKQVPNSVSVCHWDYYNLDEKHYDHMFEIHKGLGKDLWFASGSWKWIGFLPSNGYSIKTMRAALDSARNHKIEHIINTAWGDNGSEASVFSVLPSAAFFSLYALGKSDDEIKKEFFALTGYGFDEFMKLEYPNNRAGKAAGERANPTKYMLYNDVFSGQFDAFVGEGESKDFEIAKRELEKIRGQYGYIFKTAAALSEVMRRKYDMGVRLRSAYKRGDKAALSALADELADITKDIGFFAETLKKQWFKENKPYGFEIQEYRLGGLIQRLKGCSERLKEYCRGEVSEIPELNDELLDGIFNRVWSDKRFAYNRFANSASVNIF